MKISEIQTYHNLQFTANNPAKIKRVIVKGSSETGDLFVKGKKTLPVSPEIKSRIEKQIKKFRREQTYDKFIALEKEKDIKYKNMPD